MGSQKRLNGEPAILPKQVANRVTSLVDGKVISDISSAFKLAVANRVTSLVDGKFELCTLVSPQCLWVANRVTSLVDGKHANFPAKFRRCSRLPIG